LDATTLVGFLTGAAAVIGTVVAYLGKRSETALTGYSSLTDNLQEERTALRQEITELYSLRAADQAEIARLRIENAQLRGRP
jgi:hypothetical protein